MSLSATKDTRTFQQNSSHPQCLLCHHPSTLFYCLHLPHSSIWSSASIKMTHHLFALYPLIAIIDKERDYRLLLAAADSSSLAVCCVMSLSGLHLKRPVRNCRGLVPSTNMWSMSFTDIFSMTLLLLLPPLLSLSLSIHKMINLIFI